MASVLGDEIDVLAKAKRALDADYTPTEDEEYMSEHQLKKLDQLPFSTGLTSISTLSSLSGKISWRKGTKSTRDNRLKITKSRL